MHWRTFERLRREHDAHVNAALAAMSAKLGLLRGRLGEIDAHTDPARVKVVVAPVMLLKAGCRCS